MKKDNEPAPPTVETAPPLDPAATTPAITEIPPPEDETTAEARARKAAATRKKYVALGPGQSSPVMVPVAVVGRPGMGGMSLKHGETYRVVPDESTESGISETLAESLVERGLCIYTTAPAEGDPTDPTP